MPRWQQGARDVRVEPVARLDVGDGGDQIVAGGNVGQRVSPILIGPHSEDAPRRRRPGSGFSREEHDVLLDQRTPSPVEHAARELRFRSSDFDPHIDLLATLEHKSRFDRVDAIDDPRGDARPHHVRWPGQLQAGSIVLG